MADYDYDLFVIGAGSGGVRASRVAAAHGARVAVAEEYRVGGTCVIRGCVPKKLLIYGAHFAEDLADARRFGWDVPDCDFQWKTLRDNVLSEVDRLEGIYGQTLANNKVEVIAERATIVGPHTLRLASGREVTAGTILIATGATPVVPDCPGHELGITSNEAFHLESVPKRVVIAGAGYIANEFAGIFHQFGAHVTLVNRTDVILRGYDEQIRDRLMQISTMKGIEFKFHAAFQKVEKTEDGALLVHVTGHDPIACDMLMFATGRRPNTDGLGLETVGIQLDEKGAVPVDDDNRTTCHHVYAVGDVTNRVQLTPVAIREGHAFADTTFGNKPWRTDHGLIASAVFTTPEIGTVGLSEVQAAAAGHELRIFESAFRPMKATISGRNERVYMKLVVDAKTDKVLGVHILGHDAGEIIQAVAIAVTMGATKADFDRTVALHPSAAEELVTMRTPRAG